LLGQTQLLKGPRSWPPSCAEAWPAKACVHGSRFATDEQHDSGCPDPGFFAASGTFSGIELTHQRVIDDELQLDWTVPCPAALFVRPHGGDVIAHLPEQRIVVLPATFLFRL